MKLISLVMLVVFPSSALAELKHIPAWKMVGEKACYEFADAQKLLILDADLEALIKKDLEWAELTKHLQESRKQLTLALEAEKHANSTLQLNNNKLNEVLVKEVTRANLAEGRPGPFPAWLIAGGVGIGIGVVAGILLGVYVAK